jgi:hypothetical protein
MVALDAVVGVPVGAVQGRWQQVLEHDRYVAARSVVTSTGATFVTLMACSRNRRAALTSRRGDTNTSMTWPTWSIAR